ncbi:hypothetical protein SMC3_08215 [Candidatus Cryosericum hinesii]|jgi:hypothetical protein|uniref:Nucleotide modification associated domain-containing protein n=1 Tax=Candidatus Cryosericum hinesii TaxID=2290915 RepID=A0A398D8S4_9BACT|nr:hypothetical protein SMC3_08215 [Candidatus Cryosericum hinesii]
MRVILSRKGFDSGYGGWASPILPDGRMLSLPIPASRTMARLFISSMRHRSSAMNSLCSQRRRSAARSGCHVPGG